MQQGTTLLARCWTALRQDRTGCIALAVLCLVGAAGILAPLLAPCDPLALDVTRKLQTFSAAHWLGTDHLGRDVLSRLLYGIRTTLGFAVLTMFLTVSIGTLLGMLAGYLRGRTDTVLMRLCDVVMAFPGEVLILAVVGMLGPGIGHVVFACVLAKWPWYTRMIRTIVQQYAGMNYVLSARVTGFSTATILRRHILPCALGEILVLATLDTGAVVLLISALSFLGLGVQPPAPEWGMMLAEARNSMALYPQHMLAPGLAILLVVAAFNFLGDALRDALDPWHRQGAGLQQPRSLPGLCRSCVRSLTECLSPGLRRKQAQPSSAGAPAPATAPAPAPSQEGRAGPDAGPDAGQETGPAGGTAAGPAAATTSGPEAGPAAAPAAETASQVQAQTDLVLQADHVSVCEARTGRVLVSDVSFSLAKGTCLGIVGESGSGKTLLCRSLMGLLPAGLTARGRFFFEGQDMLCLSAEKARSLRGRGMGVILQQSASALDPLFTVGSQLTAIVQDRLGVSRAAAAERVLMHLDIVNLPASVCACYPHQLSGGMLQRCTIALAMALESRLIVADEPTTALDAANQKDVLLHFAHMRRHYQTSLVIVSHDLAAVQMLADEVLVMHKGQCVEQGPAARVFYAPQHEHTRHLVRTRLALTKAAAQFFGDSYAGRN